jgi:hypothetical protein
LNIKGYLTTTGCNFNISQNRVKGNYQTKEPPFPPFFRYSFGRVLAGSKKPAFLREISIPEQDTKQPGSKHQESIIGTFFLTFALSFNKTENWFFASTGWRQ